MKYSNEILAYSQDMSESELTSEMFESTAESYRKKVNKARAWVGGLSVGAAASATGGWLAQTEFQIENKYLQAAAPNIALIGALVLATGAILKSRKIQEYQEIRHGATNAAIALKAGNT